MDSTETRVRGFLKLGYFLDATEQRYPIDFSKIDRSRYLETSRGELIRIGTEKLQETFEELYDAQQDHVVPISGGYDSRLILGALLGFRDASKIETYTYGVPGSYDYELGSLIAKHVGTRHIPLPLNNFTYHRSALLEAARLTRLQSAFLYDPPWPLVQKLYGDAVLWSGYVGDAVAGSHLKTEPARTLEEARRRYLKNRALVRSTNLWQCDDEDLLPQIAGGDLPPDVLTWDEQVLFNEAVRKFTEPLVLVPGFNYRLPLINSPWMDFMFSVPDEHRRGETLMLDIARHAFPRLFNLPSKALFGMAPGASRTRLRVKRQLARARKLVHQFIPAVDYPFFIANDFEEGFRTSPDLVALAEDSLQRLDSRGVVPWLDLERLWSIHQRRIKNIGDALIVLVCLELNLAASED